MIRATCYEREGRGSLGDFWANGRNFEDYGIEPCGSCSPELRASRGA